MKSAVQIIMVFWLLTEVTFSLRRRVQSAGAREQDRLSGPLLWLAVLLGVGAALVVRPMRFGRPDLSADLLRGAGSLLIVIGLAIRWAAIFTLGRSFTTTVCVAASQLLVQNGVYRWVRHPGYAGSLLSVLGLGLAMRNWLSLIVAVLPVVAATLYRIHVEERALARVLGSAYAQYARRTSRLLPGLY